jgi:hypothetical protein
MLVAPGLAKNANLIRGENGRKAALLFDQAQLVSLPNNTFLTPHSLDLRPHIDSIASVELCELSFGPVHGHEAGNPIRSPGRVYAPAPGKLPLWNGEPGQSNGEGASYSSTPTITALHNFVQKKVKPGLRNAVAIKGTDRNGAIYHFGAGLAGAEPDRVQTVASLLQSFPSSAGRDLNVLPSESEADFVSRYLARMDQRFIAKRGLTDKVVTDHQSQLTGAKGLLYVGQPTPFELALTAEERTYWGQGVVPRYGRTRIDLWEQMAYAFKLIRADQTRSVALEIDIGDVHGERTFEQMRMQTEVVAKPLARLINSLKLAGLYDRTLIVLYTSDGGRAPAASSSGDEGKNGAILAGGMIRGGYYGDIEAAGPDADGQRYRYKMPDLDTGAPIADGTLANDKRMPAAALYKTIAKALKVPDAVVNGLADVAPAKVLPWLLRSA